MAWNVNNRACTTLWTTLFRMRQFTTNFSESGALMMSDLLFFNNASSPALRKKEAEILSDQLDYTFRIGRGAKYEAGVDRTKAMNSLIGILINEKKKVEELAKAADDCYLFWGEKINEL
jgi:hypothetical protein